MKSMSRSKLRISLGQRSGCKRNANLHLLQQQLGSTSLTYTMAVLRKAEEIERTVTDRYLEAYPGLTGKYSFHLCDSADGVKL